MRALKVAMRLVLVFLGILICSSGIVSGKTDRNVYELERMWQIGDDDEEFTIGRIEDAVVDDNGRFYMLDDQLMQICAVDTSGELLGYLGREGEGPGEFRRPSSIAWWGDGMLAVAQAMPGRLTLISTENLPGGTVPYLRSGERQHIGIQRLETYSDGFIIQTSHTVAFGSSGGVRIVTKKELVRCNRDGQEQDIVMEYELTQDPNNYVIEEKLRDPIWGEWVCNDNGALVWVNNRSRFSLSVSRSTDLYETFADRDTPTLVRSHAEVDSLREALESNALEYFARVEVVVEKTEPQIQRLLRGPSGQTWAITSRNQNNIHQDSLIEAEAFDCDGTWLDEVRIVLPGGMVEGDLLVLDWPFVLVRFQVDDDGHFQSGSRNCESCVPVYSAFRLKED